METAWPSCRNVFPPRATFSASWMHSAKNRPVHLMSGAGGYAVDKRIDLLDALVRQHKYVVSGNGCGRVGRANLPPQVRYVMVRFDGTGYAKYITDGTGGGPAYRRGGYAWQRLGPASRLTLPQTSYASRATTWWRA